MADLTLSSSPEIIKRDGRSTPERRAQIAAHNAATKRKYPTEHGLHSRIYVIWRAMKFRCYYPSHEAYDRYGGRGIKVCAEWLDDFMAFRNWALANGYHASLTLDRKDNDKGYDPGNCRWASMPAQNRNRRDNVNLTAFGETKTAKEWSRDARCNVGYIGLLGRIERGELPEQAITRPARRLSYRKRLGQP